jgi:hypothetical protein
LRRRFEGSPARRRDALPAFPDTACENGHQAHASLDNVRVQIYPTLRKRIK